MTPAGLTAVKGFLTVCKLEATQQHFWATVQKLSEVKFQPSLTFTGKLELQTSYCSAWLFDFYLMSFIDGITFENKQKLVDKVKVINN